MTNEEVIKQLKGIRSDYDVDMKRCPELVINDVTALDMAIEALSNYQNQTDSEVKTTADSVSEADVIYRQQAIGMVDDVPFIKEHPNIGLLWKAWLEDLPSAQRTGEWIWLGAKGYKTNTVNLYKCSECGITDWFEYNYCPACGAKMKNNGDD